MAMDRIHNKVVRIKGFANMFRRKARAEVMHEMRVCMQHGIIKVEELGLASATRKRKFCALVLVLTTIKLCHHGRSSSASATRLPFIEAAIVGASSAAGLLIVTHDIFFPFLSPDTSQPPSRLATKTERQARMSNYKYSPSLRNQ